MNKKISKILLSGTMMAGLFLGSSANLLAATNDEVQPINSVSTPRVTPMGENNAVTGDNAEEVSQEKLRELINKLLQISKDYESQKGEFTKASYQPMGSLIVELKTIAAKETLTKEEVLSIGNRLAEAEKGLVLKTDLLRKEINKNVEDYNKLIKDEYVEKHPGTEKLLIEYRDAIEAAKVVADKKNVSDAEYQAAYDRMKKAHDAIYIGNQGNNSNGNKQPNTGNNNSVNNNTNNSSNTNKGEVTTTPTNQATNQAPVAQQPQTLQASNTVNTGDNTAPFAAVVSMLAASAGIALTIKKRKA